MLLRLKAPAGEASGKQGQQVVYFLWRGAQTARDWTNPNQPETTDQVRIRAYLSAITKRWKTLTDSQRLSWKTYAQNNLITNRMGVSVQSTALGMYVRLNTFTQVRTSGGTWVDTAPTTAGPSPFTAILEIKPDSGTDIDFIATHGYTTLTNLWAVARMQPSVSAATNPQFAAIPWIAGVTSDTFSALAASGDNQEFSPSRFSYTVGDVVDATLQIVDQYGQASTPFKAKITTTAP